MAQMLTCMDDLASPVAPQSAPADGDASAGQPAADGTAVAGPLHSQPGATAAQPPRGHVVVIGALPQAIGGPEPCEPAMPSLPPPLPHLAQLCMACSAAALGRRRLDMRMASAQRHEHRGHSFWWRRVLLTKHCAAGATNRPDALDAALRRAGRFDREIAVGIPSEAARASILRVLTRPLRLSGDFDFGEVAKRTPGFVGADLQVGFMVSSVNLALSFELVDATICFNIFTLNGQALAAASTE